MVCCLQNLWEVQTFHLLWYLIEFQLNVFIAPTHVSPPQFCPTPSYQQLGLFPIFSSKSSCQIITFMCNSFLLGVSLPGSFCSLSYPLSFPLPPLCLFCSPAGFCHCLQFLHPLRPLVIKPS